MAARLHGPAPLLPLARQPEKRDWLRALHVAAVLAMVALVVSVVCWLQLDGRRMRQTEADWLEALELPTVEELDALIPNRHHLWARPFGGVFGKGPGKTFTRNAFGRDVRRLRLQGEATWPALCALDSDKDGLTNGEELGDPCCGSAPAWQRSWNLTHPGWKQQTLTEKQLADVGPRRTIRLRDAVAVHALGAEERRDLGHEGHGLVAQALEVAPELAAGPRHAERHGRRHEQRHRARRRRRPRFARRDLAPPGRELPRRAQRHRVGGRSARSTCAPKLSSRLLKELGFPPSSPPI